MVTFNLGPLGFFAVEFRRASPSTTPILPTHNDLPPPYTESSPKSPPTIKKNYYVGPPDARKSDSPKDQLRRYLIEIIAVSVNVNFDKLNSALHGHAITSQTTSILCGEERQYLLYMSQLVQKLQEKALRNQTNTMLRTDKMELYHAIYEPGWLLSTCSLRKYALDLVATYADIVREPDPESARQHSTLLAHWARNPYRLEDQKEDLKRALSSHATAIEIVSPSERVQHVLGAALEEYQHTCGLEFVEYGNICWPMRDGFEQLGSVLVRCWRYVGQEGERLDESKT